jgi:hypothetical protein
VSRFDDHVESPWSPCARESKRDHSDSDVVAALKVACAESGSQAAWAQAKMFSPQFICDVLKSKRDVTERLAAELGFARHSVWRRIAS